MRVRVTWLAGVAGIALLGTAGAVVSTTLASAQDAPESLLPPGFDDPAPAPTPPPGPAPAPTAAPATPSSPAAPSSSGTIQPLPSAPANLPPVPQISDFDDLPTLEELENLSTDQLDDLLGLKPQYDIPPAARRSLSQVGILSPEEDGFQTNSLANQPATLVRAILAGTRGPLVSRWGHILVRRTLASRLTAPEGMNPVDFASLRAGVLNSMGEFAVTRGLSQDIDTGNWSTAMTSEALTAYIAMSDLVGACPAVRLQGSVREDPQWAMMQAICNAYAGEGALAGSQLNAAQNEEIAPEIDILLAQRYAGAAGRGRGGVTVSWEGVEELTPWRFSIANAVGETLPDGLLEAAIEGRGGAYYQYAAASAPMLPISERAPFAEIAAGRGILSSRALVDLYSQIYSDTAIGGVSAQRAARLRDAYVGADPSIRITAMRGLWGEGGSDYAGHILTAYAAARIPPSTDHSDDAGNLIFSMLAAGLDRDAMSWSTVVEPGSEGWALIAVASAEGGAVAPDALDTFVDNDESEGSRKSTFLLAGLAGLDRISAAELSAFSGALDVDLDRQTRWTRMIDRAAQVNNAAMVSLLAGLGMQGENWSQMTPLYLFHIVSSLRRVGLEAEARMIAAEAVARG